jgi:large subunit ribosomal protein L9
MKVLLTKNVEGLGSAGQVVTVAQGYARNYLLPKKMAVMATAGSMKMAESLKAAAVARAKEQTNAAEAVAAKLRETVLEFKAVADENGQLYGGIGEREIAAALTELNIPTDRKQVLVDSHIKSIGEYQVEIKIHGDVHEKVTVKVGAEA